MSQRYEHPYAVRLAHWLIAVSLPLLIASGLEVFRAFPSFGPKIPQSDLLGVPAFATLGGWLGGALQWHFTFMWVFMGASLLYGGYQLLSGNFRQVLLARRDLWGVWPMVRHYFLFGPKPRPEGTYNPLQKLAYTTALAIGLLAIASGLALYKPVQLGWLVWCFGGLRLVRRWHFVATAGFLLFVPGHLLMVALHGWSNFQSMLTGYRTKVSLS